MPFDSGLGPYNLIPNDEYCSSQPQNVESGLNNHSEECFCYSI